MGCKTSQCNKTFPKPLFNNHKYKLQSITKYKVYEAQVVYMENMQNSLICFVFLCSPKAKETEMMILHHWPAQLASCFVGDIPSAQYT